MKKKSRARSKRPNSFTKKSRARSKRPNSFTNDDFREETKTLENDAVAEPADCLATALALSEELGTDFSAEQPHRLADRGANWFCGSIRI